MIDGLGRFSRAHMPIWDEVFRNVVVDGEVRIYDPPDGLEEDAMVNAPNHMWSAVPFFYTDCSETQSTDAFDGRGVDTTW